MRLDFTQIKYSTTKQVSDQNEGDNKHDQVANAIAVIGLSCRLPMANSPQAFWGLLRNGTNAITEMPADRWNLACSFDPAGFSIKLTTSMPISSVSRLVKPR